MEGDLGLRIYNNGPSIGCGVELQRIILLSSGTVSVHSMNADKRRFIHGQRKRRIRSRRRPISGRLHRRRSKRPLGDAGREKMTVHVFFLLHFLTVPSYKRCVRNDPVKLMLLHSRKLLYMYKTIEHTVHVCFIA